MIKIITVGKIKKPYLQEAIRDYSKRINKYHRLQIVELKDSTIEKEEVLILKQICPTDYVITLEIEGESLSSLELANKLEEIMSTNSNIVFIIGGSDGLSNQVKRSANLHLSFSKLTFPHQMFQFILLEQIYRCFKINSHQTYHK